MYLRCKQFTVGDIEPSMHRSGELESYITEKLTAFPKQIRTRNLGAAALFDSEKLDVPKVDPQLIRVWAGIAFKRLVCKAAQLCYIDERHRGTDLPALLFGLERILDSAASITLVLDHCLGKF